jgi:hypothetical protein
MRPYLKYCNHLKLTGRIITVYPAGNLSETITKDPIDLLRVDAMAVVVEPGRPFLLRSFFLTLEGVKKVFNLLLL